MEAALVAAAAAPPPTARMPPPPLPPLPPPVVPLSMPPPPVPVASQELRDCANGNMAVFKQLDFSGYDDVTLASIADDFFVHSGRGGTPWQSPPVHLRSTYKQLRGWGRMGKAAREAAMNVASEAASIGNDDDASFIRFGASPMEFNCIVVPFYYIQFKYTLLKAISTTLVAKLISIIRDTRICSVEIYVD
jgi:hypothetical protein